MPVREYDYWRPTPITKSHIMNLSPHNLPLSHIKEIYEESVSCIKKISTNYTLLLHPLNLKELKKGVENELHSMTKTYVPEFHGILMAYEGVKVTSSSGWLFDTNPFVHVQLFAHFYVFAPTVGSILRGKVVKKSPNQVGCLVHGLFNVSSSIPRSLPRSEWCGTETKEGDTIDLEITFIDLASLVPYLNANIVPGSISSIPSTFTNVKNSRIVFNDDDSGISSVGKHFDEECLNNNLSSNKESNLKFRKQCDMEEPTLPKKGKNKLDPNMNESSGFVFSENELESSHSKLSKKKKSKSKSKDLETNLDPRDSFMSDLNEFETNQGKISKKKLKSKSKDLDPSIREPNGENFACNEDESVIRETVKNIKVENDSGASMEEITPKKKKKEKKNKSNSLLIKQEILSEDDFSEGSKTKRKLNSSGETYETFNSKKKKKIKL